MHICCVQSVTLLFCNPLHVIKELLSIKSDEQVAALESAQSHY